MCWYVRDAEAKPNAAGLHSVVQFMLTCTIPMTSSHQIKGLSQILAATTAPECAAACCAQGASCETWQWCPKGGPDCQKWDKTGRCWVGATKYCRSDALGWLTAARPAPPPPPGPPPPPPPVKPPQGAFLYLASHIGVFANASTCILNNNGTLPHTCVAGGCCPVGKNGLQPAAVHSSLQTAGFVFRVSFNSSNASNSTATTATATPPTTAQWMLQVATGECSNGYCATRVASQGTVDWPIGGWRTLTLSAKRSSGGKTNVQCQITLPTTTTRAAGTQRQQQPLLASATIQVATIDEARGAIAFGSGISQLPFSQWDNLTVSPISTEPRH